MSSIQRQPAATPFQDSTLERSSNDNLLDALRHPDKAVRLIVLSELFTRDWNAAAPSTQALVSLCDLVRHSMEPIERAAAGAVLCRVLAEMPDVSITPGLRVNAAAAFRDHLRLEAGQLPDLRVPASWSTSDEMAGRLMKVRMTPVLNVAVSYWVARCLQSETPVERAQCKEVLSGWGELGRWGLRVLERCEI